MQAKKPDWKYIILGTLLIIAVSTAVYYEINVPPSVGQFFEGSVFKYGLLVISLLIYLLSTHKKGHLIKKNLESEEISRWDITALIGIFKESIELTISAKLFVSCIADIAFNGHYFPLFDNEEKYSLFLAILYLFANAVLKFLNAINCVFTTKDLIPQPVNVEP